MAPWFVHRVVYCHRKPVPFNVRRATDYYNYGWSLGSAVVDFSSRTISILAWLFHGPVPQKLPGGRRATYIFERMVALCRSVMRMTDRAVDSVCAWCLIRW